MGKYSMLTVQHSIDCFDRVEIGDYSALAGFRCTILTHSVNLVRDRFETSPVVIGHHTGIFSGVTILSGVTVPSRCIISAGSVVNTRLTEELTFYSGNPAVAIRSLPATLGYFHRGEPGRPHLPTI
jgi:acetyltransferase-like isoleucine patch superfamily enzyme